MANESEAQVRHCRTLRAFAHPQTGRQTTCRSARVPHDNTNGGYLHPEGDTAPYDVDGQLYCGNCHYSCDPSGQCENLEVVSAYEVLHGRIHGRDDRRFGMDGHLENQRRIAMVVYTYLAIDDPDVLSKWFGDFLAFTRGAKP